MDTLNLSDPDNDPDDLFASPSHIVDKKPAQAKSTFPRNLDTPKTSTVVPNLDCKETDEAALRRELAGVRKINEVIKGVVDSLERAKGNMEVCFL